MAVKDAARGNARVIGRIKWLFGLAQLEKIEQQNDKTHLQNQILFERQEIMMAAIDNLTANLAKLKADIDTRLAGQANATEAQIQAAADAVAALDAEVAPAPVG